jgi:HD-like signal output (HDOD) protein
MSTPQTTTDAGSRRAVRCLETVLKLLEDRIPHLHRRTERLLHGCTLMSQAMNLSPREERSLLLGARFKDVGLVGVPDGLIMLPQLLPMEDRNRIRRQRVKGARLFALVFPQFAEAVECIWYYMEQPDGTGPHGLRQGEIPMIAAILGLVDALESMANERPQRPPMDNEAILQEVERQNGIQFHTAVVAAFRRKSKELLHALRAVPETEVSAVADVPEPLRGPTPSAAPRPAKKTSKRPRVTSIRDLSPTITKSDLLGLVTKGLELKPLAPTVQHLLSTLGDPRCSNEDVANAIVQDQTLALRVLKLANSSAYSRGRPLSGIKDAVGRIGIQGIRQIALTLGVLERYEGALSQYLDAHLFWEHSLACGVTCVTIAKSSGYQDIDSAFLWGILHDVGRLVLADNVPDQYTKVWEATEILDVPLELVEARIMLLDHCDILRKALEYWKFSKEFIIPVVHHHQSMANLKRLGPEVVRGAAIVALANALTHALLLGSSGNDVIYPVEEYVEAVGMERTALASLMEVIPEEVSNLKLSLQLRGPGTEWPDFAAKLRTRLRAAPVPLCISRQPETDVFGMFFRRLCASGALDAPNLAVLYVPDTRELDHALKQLAEAENGASDAALPVIVVCSRGQIEEGHPGLSPRPHCVLRTPVRMIRLIEAANDLLDPDGAAGEDDAEDVPAANTRHAG